MKATHPNGVVGRANWISEGEHPFTGMFESGADTCIVRLSLALDPAEMKATSVPSVAIKLLRDKMESANYLALIAATEVSIDDLNFFGINMWNHIPIPVPGVAPPFFKQRMSEPTNYIGQIGLSEMATYDQEGKRVGNPVFPWRVRAEPSGDFTTGADHLGDL